MICVKRIGMSLAGVAVLWAAGAWAADAKAPAAGDTAKDPLRYGADIRLREEAFDNIPIKAGGVTRGGTNIYFRIRPRVWAEFDAMDDVTIRARLASEFREYLEPDNADGKRYWEWPEEWVFDHLYLDVRNLMDKRLDLRIGRQDLIYGNGRVILEGNPGDGSRTIYFNAVKAVWKGIENTTVDAFGIYNEGKDDYAINKTKRNLSITGADEAGGGFYVKNKSWANLPCEFYGVFKTEQDYPATPTKRNPATGQFPATRAWQSVTDLGNGNGLIETGDFDCETVGFRLMPAFSPEVKGNLEVAAQVGERGDEDMFGMMVDGTIGYTFTSIDPIKPTLDAGVYYLSGDDPGTAKDEGWNPVWARYPQHSELYVFAYDAEAARWSNLIAPNLRLTAAVCPQLKVTAYVHYLLADEDDGPGTGKERGILTQLKGEFNFGKGLLASRDTLTAHLWLETLAPGDYYVEDDTAYFARWEIIYGF